jgi:hypothetical protein
VPAHCLAEGEPQSEQQTLTMKLSSNRYHDILTEEDAEASSEYLDFTYRIGKLATKLAMLVALLSFALAYWYFVFGFWLSVGAALVVSFLFMVIFLSGAGILFRTLKKK